MSQAGRYSALLFFFVFFCTGLFIFRDYGVHVDEMHNEMYGRMWGGYLTGNAPPEKDGYWHYRDEHNLLHGPALELPLYFARAEFLAPQAPQRRVLLLRHFLNFLLYFAALIFFYLTCRELFQSSWAAIAGVAMLAFSPRIFADAFYNTVDIGLLSLAIIAAYTMVRFFRRPSYATAAWHALACAECANVRLAGLVVPAVSIALFSAHLLRRGELGKNFRFALTFTLLFALLFVLVCPFYWHNTFQNITGSLNAVTFLTQERPSVPWSYNFFWIGITTPPIVIVLFIAGSILAVVGLFRPAARPHVGVLASLLIFIVPLGAAIAADSRLYNSWRHHYFIYPSMVVVALYGGTRIFDACSRRFNSARSILVAIFICTAAYYVSILYTLHPFQFSYFNVFRPDDPAILKAGADYWRLSERTAVELVAQRDERPKIILFFPRRNWLNVDILPEPMRRRFEMVRNPSAADYVITPHYDDISWPETEFSKTGTISVGTQPLTDIYARRALTQESPPSSSAGIQSAP